ncbi:hypothetical protein D3C84_1067140 [compost metagenome]
MKARQQFYRAAGLELRARQEITRRHQRVVGTINQLQIDIKSTSLPRIRDDEIACFGQARDMHTQLRNRFLQLGDFE